MNSPLAFLQNIGMPELIVIMVIALLLFGNRLPQVARNIGKGLTEFKRGMSEAQHQVAKEIEAAGAMPTAPSPPDTVSPPASAAALPAPVPVKEQAAAGTPPLDATRVSAPVPQDNLNA